MAKPVFQSFYYEGYDPSLVRDYGSGDGERILIVSFPGSLGNRDLNDDQRETGGLQRLNKNRPQLLKTLCSANADTLFVRSYYDSQDPDFFDANVTSNFGDISGYLRDLQKTKKYDSMIGLGFSKGCGPCVCLARKGVLKKAVLVALPNTIFKALTVYDTYLWIEAFEKLRAGLPFPTIDPFPPDVDLKLVYGALSHVEKLGDADIARMFKHYAPHLGYDAVEEVPWASHEVLDFWRMNGKLFSEVHRLLGVRSKERYVLPSNRQIKWKTVRRDQAPGFRGPAFVHSSCG